MPEAEILASLLKTAGMFDVHKWSDYPEVKAIVDSLFQEVIKHRKEKNPKSRIRDGEKIKKHLRVLLLDLYVSSQSLNPWRSISKRKGVYKKEVSRYRKLHLKYDFLIPMVNDLVELDYVEEKMETGFRFTNPNEKGRCGCGESFHV